MSHLSIAILRSRKNVRGKEHYEYLIQFNEEGTHMFFDVREFAIGGGFDYFKLSEKIVDYFELPSLKSHVGRESSDFEDKRRFKESRVNPFATSFIFDLSLIQERSINQSIVENQNDEKWKYLKWIKQDDFKQLKSVWKEDQLFIFQEEEPFEVARASNDLRAGLKNIAKANMQGKLVIFAGAGVSIESMLPSWSELTSGLQGDLDQIEDDDLKLAQLYYETRGNKEYQEKVQELLKLGKTKYNPIHESIVNISPLHIITTNFDDHFEQIHREKGFKYSIVKRDADLPYSKGTSLYIKMHGDLSSRNIVLKEEDYDYEKNFPLIDGFVKGVFSSKLVLFVGFSNNDPNLNRIQAWVSNILKEDGQRPYIVMNTVDPARKIELESKKRLKVLEIGAANNEKAIEEYFTNTASDDVKSKLDLLTNTRSKKLFKFLNVISEYDELSESSEIMPIEEQLIQSLDRFSEFEAVPIDTLINLIPFKRKGSPDNAKFNRAEYEYGELGTPNERLLKYVIENCENGKLIFYSYQDETRNSRQQKLDRIWKLLWNSGVRFIKRKNDTSAEKYSITPKNKDLPPSESQCHCSKCRFYRSEIGDLLKDLNKSSEKNICKHSHSESSLDEAYGYFNTGYVVKAYYALEELKNLSWNKSEYVTFFLAAYNQKKLKPFVWYSNAHFSEESELELINQQINKIDLDKLLIELPVDKDVRGALSIIRSESIHERMDDIADQRLSEITEMYEKYAVGGIRHQGPNYWYLLEHHIFDWRNFYINNRLFDVKTNKFRGIIDKYLKGIITSFQTSNEYNGRLTAINHYFAYTAIYHGYPENLQNHLESLKVSFLRFHDPENFKEEFIPFFNDFVQSGYNETTFFKSTVRVNELYAFGLKNSSLFSNLTKHMFNNFMLLFTHLDFGKEHSNSVVSKSLKYLQVVDNFGYVDSLKYWAYFVEKRIRDFSEESLILICDFLLSKIPNGYGHVQGICTAIINEGDKREFLPVEFLEKVKENYNPDRSEKMNLFGFYPLLQKEQQTLFYDWIKDDLLKERNDFKTKAFYWGIWHPIENQEVFDSFFFNLKKVAKGFPDFKIREDGIAEDIWDFTVWNDLVNLTLWTYQFDLFSDARVANIRKMIDSNMFKWMLNPQNYDYKDFEMEWFNTFRGNVYYKYWKDCPQLIEFLEQRLKIEFNDKAAEVYFSIKP